MASKPPRIYVDANVFVNVFTAGREDNPDWLQHSMSVLERGQASDIEIVISALILAEVLGCGSVRGDHVPRKARQHALAQARAYFRDNDLTLVELDRRVADRVCELCVEHQLTGQDGVHLASALAARCRYLLTWDEGLLKVGRTEDLEVTRPEARGQLSLDSVAKPDDGSSASR